MMKDETIERTKRRQVFMSEVKRRDSSIELFRIISMLIIVAHHYVVNSGLMDTIASNSTTWNSIFLLLFGWGGKTAINCFVFITGYFMCQSNITWKKFLKLFLEFKFYKIVFYLVFFVTGYTEFSIKELWEIIFPINSIGSGFVGSYLAFYLFIPFVNLLITSMSEKMHQRLIALCICLFTVLPTFFFTNVKLSYVSWFITLYLIAAYVRLYPKRIFDNRKVWGIALFVSLLLSWCSVIAGIYVGRWIGKDITYYFVADSNKALALVTSFCAFLFFKNLNMGYNRCINTIAASSFGVLLIHANSDIMRTWLWQDVCQNTSFYGNKLLILHAVGTVLVIYIVCTCIDILRIKYLEKPFFGWLDKKFSVKEKGD